MNIEVNEELRRRAVLHAALSDPARLAIADTLALGDASPSELQEALGMPSNLLAHHLKVLESAGLLTRHRSEADRRRTYLRLASTPLLSLSPAPRRQVGRVVFVCTRASARSQLARALWRRASRIPAVAAGTHPAGRVSTGAVETAHRHGLPLTRVRPQHLDDVRGGPGARGGDLVITVCDHAREELGALPDLHWSIPDPVPADTPAAFDAALEELSRRVADLAPRLAS
ncbi:MAG TPA: helix-turn-helix domain-containing protein [Jatrophihabitans sp.]|jgi:protein-tyrosine-phosphatase|uniref:helix-turn-helix domain-containing protein n=1 Tax=Jatrophihabitans sp. TaxID=1932789 RepID=UPI002E08445A|nr:helix-turn-helix domain-containing protein [Jatrophihabitans sp.]